MRRAGGGLTRHSLHSPPGPTLEQMCRVGEGLTRRSPDGTLDHALRPKQIRPAGPLGGDGVNVLGMRKG